MMRWSKTVIVVTVVLMHLTCIVRDAMAQDTIWQANPATVGDWFDDGNWTLNVPNEFTSALINNGGTVKIGGNIADVKDLWVGRNGNGSLIISDGMLNLSTALYTGLSAGDVGQVTINGGTINGPITVADRAGTTGVITMTDGLVQGLSFTIGGGFADVGTGTVYHSGGVINVQNPVEPTLGDFNVYRGTGSGVGRYELSATGQLLAGVGHIWGEYTQSGGTATYADQLEVAYGGEAQLSDGLLYPRVLVMRKQATFTQSGGILHTSYLTMGESLDADTHYILTGGSLTIDDYFTLRANNGASSFTQQAGDVSLHNFYMQADSGSGTTESVQYGLQAGTLNADRFALSGYGGTATVDQTGGTFVTDTLVVEGPDAVYRYRGGSLQVNQVLQVVVDNSGAADFDLDNAAVTLTTGDQALLDFSGAQVVNASNAHFIAGADSLLVAPAGSNIPAQFASFSQPNIVVYNIGSMLQVQATQSVAIGYGYEINDHVVVDGKVTEAQYGVDLWDGITVSAGGSVELPNSQIRVAATASGITGGSLRASILDLRNNTATGSPTFTQDEGEVTVERLTMSRAYNSYYTLNDGTLNATRLLVSNSGTQSGAATFQQNGGVANLRGLDIGSYSQGFYELNDGELNVQSAVVRNSSVFEQTGGIVHADSLSINNSSVYRYTGGSLDVTRRFSIYSSGTLDFGSASTALVAHGAVVDLVGTIINEQNASLIVDDESLVIVKSSFDPVASFATYVNPGILHVAGQTLTIGAGKTIRGTADLRDFTVVQGQLIADDTFNMLHGLRVEAGAVADVGAGRIVALLEYQSGVYGGSLYAHNLRVLVSNTQTLTFEHTAGSAAFDGLVEIGGQNAHYIFSDGSMDIFGTLQLRAYGYGRGTLDFDHGDGVLTVRSGGFLNFENGYLVNTENASLYGEADTLISFAAGFDPYTAFADFHTDGLVHVNGQDLIIASGVSIHGSSSIEGNVLNQGSLGPGNSPGTLEILGDYIQDASAELLIEIAGTAAADFDLLNISGSVSLNGQLTIKFLNGFLPTSDESFNILTASAITGTFANAATQVFIDNGVFDVTYTDQAITLNNFQVLTASIPEPDSAAVLVGALAMIMCRRRRIH